MTRDEAATFASSWAAAWNARAVERVLAAFSDEVTFTSPTALVVADKATLHGKAALRTYWNQALGFIGTLRFTVERVLWDAATRELAIIYVSYIDGRAKRVSENLTFGTDGLIVSAEVFHGVAVERAP